MKVLITGGAGFIGSHVTEALLKRGDEVVCVDNFNDFYSPERKRRNVADFLSQPSYRLCEADIRDMKTLETLFEGEKFDKLLHIAAMANVRYSLKHPLLYEDVNVRGTLNLLELARRYEVRHFLFASTSSVYGATDKIPFTEDDPTDRPLAPYPATKKAGEVLAYTYHHAYGLNCICLRFFSVYGPRGRPDMTPYFFTRDILAGREITLFDQGRPQRDWTYIDDIVSGVMAALDADFGYEIINLGNSKPVAMRDFVTIIEELVGRKARLVSPPLPPSEAPVTYAAISKARRLLGYDPRTPVEEGMKYFVAWYRREVLGEQVEPKQREPK